MPQPLIDYTRYNGYLYKVLKDIVAAYQRGYTPRQIADDLIPRLTGYYVSSSMVTYILRRVGAIQDCYTERSPQELRRIEINARLRHPEWYGLPEHYGMSVESLGRPLDMGGPRDVWIEQSPWDDL